jgi:hypothetical protein
MEKVRLEELSGVSALDYDRRHFGDCFLKPHFANASQMKLRM